jgi:hypothetical protein
MLDCVGDTVLETIFDCCSAEELEFSFDFVGNFFEAGFSFVDGCGSYFVSSIPVTVILLREISSGNT